MYIILLFSGIFRIIKITIQRESFMNIAQIETLEKLGELKDKGVLTAEEFEKQKQEILNQQNKSQNSDLPEDPNRNIFQCYADCFRKYFQFSGRSSRYEYWSFYLVNVLIDLILAIPALEVIGAIYPFVAIIPGLAVCVRRMHDINKSGWKLFAPIGMFAGIMIVAAFLSAVMEYAGVTNEIFKNIKTVFFVASGFVGIFVLVGYYVYWMAKKGDDQANKYGPVPFVEEKKHLRVVHWGIGLIITLPILGMLSVAYTKALDKYDLQKTMDQVTLLYANIKEVYASEPNYNSLYTESAVAAGIVPEDMIDEETHQVLNVYKGNVYTVGEEENFAILFEQIPENICQSLGKLKDYPDVISASCHGCQSHRCLFVLESM